LSHVGREALTFPHSDKDMATETITMENIFRDIPELHTVHRRAKQRGLEGEKNYQNYLVDKDGVEYDPYSLAWRYLGLYIDCNADNGDDDHDNHNNHRRLHEDEGGQCQRKLLWAAYVDRRYEGNTIEEYKFYDINTGDWDNSTCLASGEEHRCVKLNCHEPHTKFQGNSWELVGVFKETNGMYDWFEQLFKHEGTCIWNDNEVYGTMETWMEKFPTQCTKLSVSDEYGNTIYMSTTPLAEGNMTLGIYTDKNCMTLSEDMDYSSYIVKYYQSYYERSYYYYYGYSSCELFIFRTSLNMYPLSFPINDAFACLLNCLMIRLQLLLQFRTRGSCKIHQRHRNLE